MFFCFFFLSSFCLRTFWPSLRWWIWIWSGSVVFTQHHGGCHRVSENCYNPYRTLCCYTQVPRCTLILFNVYTSVVWWHREGTTLTLPYLFIYLFAHEDFRFCTKVLAVTWQRRTYQVVLTVNPDEWFGRKWWWELSWCHCYCYTQINKSLCVCVCVCNRPRANTWSWFCLCTFSDRLLLTLTAAANANRSALNGILHSCKKFFFARNVKLT